MGQRRQRFRPRCAGQRFDPAKPFCPASAPFSAAAMTSRRASGSGPSRTASLQVARRTMDAFQRDAVGGRVEAGRKERLDAMGQRVEARAPRCGGRETVGQRRVAQDRGGHTQIAPRPGRALAAAGSPISAVVVGTAISGRRLPVPAGKPRANDSAAAPPKATIMSQPARACSAAAAAPSAWAGLPGQARDPDVIGPDGVQDRGQRIFEQGRPVARSDPSASIRIRGRAARRAISGAQRIVEHVLGKVNPGQVGDQRHATLPKRTR
jgi:hypothetical protein